MSCGWANAPISVAHRDPAVDKQSSAAHFSRNTKEAADTAAEGVRGASSIFNLTVAEKQTRWVGRNTRHKSEAYANDGLHKGT